MKLTTTSSTEFLGKRVGLNIAAAAGRLLEDGVEINSAAVEVDLGYRSTSKVCVKRTGYSAVAIICSDYNNSIESEIHIALDTAKELLETVQIYAECWEKDH